MWSLNHMTYILRFETFNPSNFCSIACRKFSVSNISELYAWLILSRKAIVLVYWAWIKMNQISKKWEPSLKYIAGPNWIIWNCRPSRCHYCGNISSIIFLIDCSTVLILNNAGCFSPYHSIVFLVLPTASLKSLYNPQLTTGYYWKCDASKVARSTLKVSWASSCLEITMNLLLRSL